MTRLFDRILERAPGLAETLLGDPGEPGLPLLLPVVVAGDAVFPRAAAALLAGPARSPSRCTPPWPLTFVEFATPPGLPGTLDGLPVPSATGWMFLKESDQWGGPGRFLASLVIEAGETVVGPVAILALELTGAGRVRRRPGFLLLLGPAPDGAGRGLKEDRILQTLYPALVTLARVNAGGPGLCLVTPDAGVNEGRVARGLAPLQPYFMPPAGAA